MHLNNKFCFICSDEEEDEDEEEESELKKLYPETYKTNEPRLLRGKSYHSMNKSLKIPIPTVSLQQILNQTVTMKKKKTLIIALKKMNLKKCVFITFTLSTSTNRN